MARPTDVKTSRISDGATLFEEAPTYDALGNITRETTTLPSGTDVQQFCYDDFSRLTWAGSTGTPPCTGTAITPGTLTAAQYTQSFSYDIQDRLRSSPLGSYSYDDANHLHAATFVDSGTDDYSATYDDSGNMLTRAPSESQPQQKLSWDNEGRLTAWQNAPSSPTSTAQYLYDGEGNRVEQQTTLSGTTTTTVYVGDIEQVATTGGTSTTTTYYYANGQRIALAVNGTLSYLASDLLGSATVALNTSGTPTASQLYAPYGGIRYSNGAMPTDYGFTGQRADGTTGLDYYGARYYDPTLGQFTSADTVMDGLNRYGYVGDNPISHTDPSGHFVKTTEGEGPAQTTDGESPDNIIASKYTGGSDSVGAGGVGPADIIVWGAVILFAPLPITLIAVGTYLYSQAHQTGSALPTTSGPDELTRALAHVGPDTDYWNQRNAPKSKPGKSTPPRPKHGGGGAGGTFGGGGGAAPGSPEDDECGCGDTVTAYRVQGGLSMERILVDESGNISIVGKGMLHFGFNAAHAEYFLGLRGLGAYVVAFQVQTTFLEFLRSVAKPQNEARANRDSPQIDDPNDWSDLYGIKSNLFDELLEFTVPGSGRVITDASELRDC